MITLTSVYSMTAQTVKPTIAISVIARILHFVPQQQRKNNNKLELALYKYKNKLLKLSERLKKSNDNQDEILLLNGVISNVITDYYQNKANVQEIVDVFEKPIMIQRMLSKAKEIFDNKLLIKRYSAERNVVAHVQTFSVIDYLTCILGSENNGYVLDSGVLCAADFGAPLKRMRFVIMGIKKSINPAIALPIGRIDPDNYTTVRDAIYDISDVQPIYEVNADKGIALSLKPNRWSSLTRELRDSDKLYNHIITKTKETALRRFAAIKVGENFHSLDTSMKEDTYTDVTRTQKTIYLRLDYDQPSGTVVNVRKSMWIHPEYNRAVSIREAARLQTFPDSFIFMGNKDSQYQQVGNAVPPILAKAIATELARLLDNEPAGKKENSNTINI